MAQRFEPPISVRQNALLALLVSGMMTCVVSGIATLRAIGLVEGFVGQWLSSWLLSWLVAYPMLLGLRPFFRRLVVRLMR